MQEEKEREESVREAAEEREAKSAPPFPFEEVHEVKVDELSVRNEGKSFNSITAPFPSFRVIFSIVPILIVLSVSVEEREMKGEEVREILDI